jgi:uridylate kinase
MTTLSNSPAYQRILLKLSGEALMGEKESGLDPAACRQIVEAIALLHKEGVEIGIVVGGGNIFRGSQGAALGIERSPADHIGMFATLINAIALQQMISHMGLEARVMSSLGATEIVEAYCWRTARQALSNGEIVLFAGGTGNPYFTTDSNAALRAAQMGADVVLKATKVDGVYDRDPAVDPDAHRFSRISYQEVLERQLGVMDLSAISICLENRIPIKVFAIPTLYRAVMEVDFGTVVTEERVP